MRGRTLARVPPSELDGRPALDGIRVVDLTQFDEDGGKNAGGAAIFITHQLSVAETDDGLIVTLQSNGYQTSKDLTGTAKVQGDKLLIYFEDYGENNVFETYQKGDLLLTLERKTAKGKTEILTHWGKFTPVVPKNEKSGKVYFTRLEIMTK